MRAGHPGYIALITSSQPSSFSRNLRGRASSTLLNGPRGRVHRKSERILRFRSKTPVGEPHKEIQNSGRGSKRPDGFQIGRYRVRFDLLIELVAQDNHILEMVGEHGVIRALVVPELSFPQEVEPGLLHHLCRTSELIGAEEDSRAEDAFKGCDQATIFCSALVHAEDLQHLPGSPEPNDLAFLLHGQGCQEARHNTVFVRIALRTLDAQ